MRAPLLGIVFAFALFPAATAQACVPTTSTTDGEHLIEMVDDTCGGMIESDTWLQA